MEAIFRKSEFDCYNKTLLLYQRKEESRDVVVPDTQPDISEVFFCGTRVLIRSKDVSPGRVRTEAILGADVLYKGEDGKLWSVEISLPFFFSIDDERIGADCVAQAKLSIVGAEAKALNPRKILLRAELNAEISVYEKAKLAPCEEIEGSPLLRSRKAHSDLSLITAVTEKTFAVSDEISLPPAAEGARTLICLGTDSCVDELKAVGSKIIIKGKLKSCLIIINEEGELCHLEPESDFSQIVETGTEQIDGVSQIYLCPSGLYCDILRDNKERISLEYHMVAQLMCRLDSKLCYIDEVYSNSFELQKEYTELDIETVREHGREREKQRLLIETPVGVNEVLCSYVCLTGEIVEKGKITLPYSLSALCLGDGGLISEKRRGEISFRVSDEGECCLKNAEICDWALLPVPGGLELRLEASGELICKSEKKISYVSKLSFDEDKLIDNSDKPSLVLLRLGREDDLWELAKENCSSAEAIMSANGLEDISEAVGKLILIPKTN